MVSGRHEWKAALIDLDGVVTDTARLHTRCWKRVFDEVLERRAAAGAEAKGEDLRPFDPERDYREHVDGKSRRDGIRDFLASRGIQLPEGTEEERADDESEEDSVSSIARRKDLLFGQALATEGVETYPGTLRWIEQLREGGIRTAVVSSSHHCAEVLRAAGIEALFDERVDGELGDRIGLAGKPAPDFFLEAARRLGVDPAEAMVVEDALSGVRAGRAGRFGQVVGVARHDDAAGLAAAGADVVVRDLQELIR
jgi:beta-phosphoglucomutase family hydrolase